MNFLVTSIFGIGVEVAEGFLCLTLDRKSGLETWAQLYKREDNAIQRIIRYPADK